MPSVTVPEVCPKHVDPANAVNINKTNAAKDYFLRFLSPVSWAEQTQTLRPFNGWLVEEESLLRRVRDPHESTSGLRWPYAITLLVGLVWLGQGEAA